MHIVYCKSDGRMITITRSKSGAQMVYQALANTGAFEEDYEYKSLRDWYLQCGYPADDIGDRIMFATSGYATRPHPFTQ